jgi:hypothetical protein
MGIRVVLAFVLLSCARLANSADGPMPWAFVNGSAEGVLDQARIGVAGAWHALSGRTNN